MDEITLKKEFRNLKILVNLGYAVSGYFSTVLKEGMKEYPRELYVLEFYANKNKISICRGIGNLKNDSQCRSFELGIEENELEIFNFLRNAFNPITKEKYEIDGLYAEIKEPLYIFNDVPTEYKIRKYCNGKKYRKWLSENKLFYNDYYSDERRYFYRIDPLDFFCLNFFQRIKKEFVRYYYDPIGKKINDFIRYNEIVDSYKK